MELAEARRQATELFGELRPASVRHLVEVGRREGQGLGFAEQLQHMTPPGFALPGLLLFGFTQLLDLEPYGPEEKLRWGVSFDFRDATFAFEYRKFGLRALCEPTNLDAAILKEVLGRSRALTNIAEAYLASGYAAGQLAAGRFSMQNLYGRLDARYRFLRDQAQSAYSTPPPPPKTGQSKFGTWTEFDYGRPEREGGALGTAAVDAYFSRQEHLFCLASAFIADRLPPGGVLEFLAANWPAKSRTVLDLQDPAAKTFYDKLLNIREEWRNPLAHGGFLSGGGSLHFHVPRIGAFPARLRRTPAGLSVGFTLHSASFTEITDLFDAFDAFLREGPLRYPLKWAESGLDVAFDPRSVADYVHAMQSEGRFDAFLEWKTYESDRHANMDY